MEINQIHWIVVSVIFFFIFFSPAQAQIHVTFLNPGISNRNDPTGGFWLSVSSFMKAAANDLNMKLEVIYSERDHILMQEQASDVAARSTPPDYLIVVNEKLVAGEIIKDADKAGIKTFLILNGFHGDQAKAMGSPRQKYKNWIGTLTPDNFFAGYEIAKLTIDMALKSSLISRKNSISMIGVSGDYVTQASVERVSGLRKAVSEYPEIDLKRVVTGLWRQDLSKEKVLNLLDLYPDISVVWAANDPMALGAMEAAMMAGRKPGKDIFFGGLNWDPPALMKIKEGSLATSLGGHFMTGGFALVMIYDYQNGKDFRAEGVQEKRRIFSAMDSRNVDGFLSNFKDRNWDKIDFTRFSKVLNHKLKKYKFDLQSIMKAVK